MIRTLAVKCAAILVCSKDDGKTVAETASHEIVKDVAQALHQQKTFPSVRNGAVRVDALRQSRQRHPGGGLLSAWRQNHASHCISPSDRHFAISSRSVGLQF